MTEQKRDRALVLGGGGVAGHAWMTGLLFGFFEMTVDLRSADLVIGTSAGSTLGAQLGSEVSLEMLFNRQVDPALQVKELPANSNLIDSFQKLLKTVSFSSDKAKVMRRIGRMALSTKTVAESERRAVIERRLPNHIWSDFPLEIIGIDTESGDMRIFDKDSDVSLVDAVLASCAVPGIWPPATIGDKRYMDGGVRSPDNADLAAGYSRVLIISPMGAMLPEAAGGTLKRELRAIEKSGGKAFVVAPDGASRVAIGLNPLNPAHRRPAAEAGRVQGHSVAQDLKLFWK